MDDNDSVELTLGPAPHVQTPDPPLLPEAVHLPDTRTAVTQESLPVHPYNAVHLLFLVWPDGSKAIGTAWAVSPRTLVTAGHNLLHPPSGMTSGVRVFHRGLGTWVAPLEATTVDGWKHGNGTDHRFDYGGLLLPPDAAILPPHLTPRALEGAVLGLGVKVAGFPHDKPFGTMWQDDGPIGAVDDLIRYDVDTAPGQSGSPVLAPVAGGFVAVGVHVDADPSQPLNVGVRLDEDKIATINGWKA